MTIRDLIQMGANLDDEIMIEVKIYDNDGNRTGTFFSYDGVDDADYDGNIIIKANVESV